MPPGQFYSGNSTADRRAGYARMLGDAGDHAAAAELMEQALDVVPHWAAGWFTLGEYREKAGLAGVEHAYRLALALDPEDVLGASLRLARIGAIDAPEQPPSRHIENLFDTYAERFDRSLVDGLQYTTPAKLSALAMEYGPFKLTADIGCGTGLFGSAIRAGTERLEGFDLSAGMLAKARAKQVYDHLGRCDLNLQPERSGLFSEKLPEARADLVSAADVFVYLGRLTTVFPIVLKLLVPGGLFAFSVEDAGADGDVVLRESLRYAHSQDHINASLRDGGLALLHSEKAVIRSDGGKPVEGMLFLSTKPA